jgi:hypothetical protein
VCELGVLDPRGDLLIEFVKSASEGAGEFGEIGEDSAQAGTQEPAIDAGEEQGGAQAVDGKSETMGAADALVEVMESESARVRGHLSGAKPRWCLIAEVSDLIYRGMEKR